MPVLEQIADIRGTPEAVFDIITCVEDFVAYSPLIKRIERIAPEVYRWTVRVRGLTLHWDAQVTEYDRPHRFAWSSVKGVKNAGVISLECADDGTRVAVSMHYKLPTRFLEKAIAPIADPLIERISQEILDAVKARVEPTV